MTPALVLYCALAGWCAGEPPLPPYHMIPRFPPESEIETPRSHHLETTRMTRKFLEENIVLYVEILEVMEPKYLTPAEASAIRQDIEHVKKQVEELKRIERELWERQPGGITAPAPRPKGTPLPPPPRVRD